MATNEIVLPNTEPETEWVRSRPLQKVSPTRAHSLVQLSLAAALRSWAGKRGEVGTEWRFRVAPPDQPLRPLVPDVAYVAIERLRGLRGYELDVPALAPDAVVEVISPGDRRADIDDKIRTYLAAGSRVVIVADPGRREIEVHDVSHVVVARHGDVVTHASLHGFRVTVADIFDQLEPPS